MGNEYAYQDTVLDKAIGPGIQHRFYRPIAFNSSLTFMTDDGKILGGHFPMPEDIFD